MRGQGAEVLDYDSPCVRSVTFVQFDLPFVILCREEKCIPNLSQEPRARTQPIGKNP